MGVQVQITFSSLDEAIVALGKLALPVKAVNIAPPAPLEPKPVVEKTPRKPRADAGQPRGPYKKDEPNAAGANAGASGAATAGNSSTVTTDPSDAGQQAAASTSTTTAATSPAPATSATPTPPPAPAAPVPAQEHVQAAVEKIFTARGYEDCLATLQRFGVERGQNLKPEQRAAFIAKVDRVLAGEAI